MLNGDPVVGGQLVELLLDGLGDLVQGRMVGELDDGGLVGLAGRLLGLGGTLNAFAAVGAGVVVVASASGAGAQGEGQGRGRGNGEEFLDDVVLFSAGNQICADCIVLYGEVQVNESLVTGESDEIKKAQGDKLLSGSYVVSGE